MSDDNLLSQTHVFPSNSAGPPTATPADAESIHRWRRAERDRLRKDRAALTVEERRRIAEAITGHLDTLLSEWSMTGQVLSGYWPIKGEPDLRPWLGAWHEKGAITALPSVEIKVAPLVFRAWTPETRMVRGDWNIPVPPPEAEEVTPQITLAPLIGWDHGGYRLGYGGGYFDRTLAALTLRPFAIGVGLQMARIDSIRPLPHDIPLDAIVTEDGVQMRRLPDAGRSRPQRGPRNPK